MMLRKTIFGVMLALIFLSALTPPVFAQDPNRLAQLKISVWPEYDTSTVLVLIDGTLADQSNLPRQVSVLVPASAELFVTTWENPDGSLAPEQSSKATDLGDGYRRVTFTITQPKYRVEYYHDILRGSPDKTMDFAFKAIAPADRATLEIQQPRQATNFAVTPATQNTRQGADGFKYFVSDFANVTAGQAISAQVKYTKTDPNPSVQPPAAPSAQPATAPVPAADSTSSLLLLVGLVVLGLAAVLGYFLLQQRSREAEQVAAKMSPRQFQRNRRRAKPAASGTLRVFCTQCGSTLGPDDNFCPTCGAKRRVVPR